MYCIWILMGLPIGSLLCAAFIAMRDGKVAPANAAVRPTQSASGITPLSKVTNGGDWNSKSAEQVLIGILSNPSDDGFRVTIRQFEGEQESKFLDKRDDKASSRSKSEVWISSALYAVRGGICHIPLSMQEQMFGPHRPSYPQEGGYDYENLSYIATN